MSLLLTRLYNHRIVHSHAKVASPKRSGPPRVDIADVGLVSEAASTCTLHRPQWSDTRSPGGRRRGSLVTTPRYNMPRMEQPSIPMTSRLERPNNPQATEHRSDSQLGVPLLRRRSPRIQAIKAHSLPTTAERASGIAKNLPSADPRSPSHVLASPSVQQSRKRRFVTSVQDEKAQSPKRARLTAENLRTLDGDMGSTKSANVRRSKSSLSEGKSRSSAATESSGRTVSTTDAGFARIAFQNGVLDPDRSMPPRNLASHQYQLDRARDSASPSHSDYEEYVHEVRHAPNETTMPFAISTLFKKYEQGYGRMFNQAFNDFPKGVGFNNGLSAAQPDMVEGLRMTQFAPFPAQQVLGGSAVPAQTRDPVTLPHLAAEWKGPGKNMIVAESQAAYDGACMSQGRTDARSVLGKPDVAGHAYVFTFTTDGTVVNTFAHHQTESEGRTKYHQYPTSSSLLISSFEDYKKGRRRIRNLQDAAKASAMELRDTLASQHLADQHLGECHDSEQSTPIADPTELEDTALDGDNDDDTSTPDTQLLSEYWNSFTSCNEDAQITTAGNVPVLHHDDVVALDPYESAEVYLATPPQSSKGIPLPAEQSEMSGEISARAQRRIRHPLLQPSQTRKLRKKR